MGARTTFLSAAFLLSPQMLQAGFERTAQPATVFGIGGAALFSDNAESLLLNPSALASLHSFHAACFFSPSPFDIPQLSTKGVFAAESFDFFNAAAAMTTTGFSLYREVTATITAAKSFDGNFCAGCNINYNYLEIARYGTAGSVGVDIAASLQINDDVRWGFSFLNVNRPTIGITRDELPQVYLTGISCALLPTANVSCAVVKDVRFPVSFRAGTEFSPVEILHLRFAVSSEPSRYFAGIGIHCLLFDVDYGIATHLDLGLTHSVEISFGL